MKVFRIAWVVLAVVILGLDAAGIPYTFSSVKRRPNQHRTYSSTLPVVACGHPDLAHMSATRPGERLYH